MTKLLDSFTGELGKAWWLRLLSPAAAFWFAGLLAIFGWSGLTTMVQTAVSGSGNDKWILILALSFGVVSASAWLVEQVTVLALRLLEGYWPDVFGIASRRSELMRARRDAFDAEWQKLCRLPDPTRAQVLRRIQLDRRLRRYPQGNRILPTRLGNILCSAELWPIAKYGLDVVTCWPHLWMTLPKDNRDDLSAARAALDDGVRTWVWSAVALIWTLWSPFAAPLAAVSMGVAYLLTLKAAEDYADLLEAAFDLRRMSLYDALGFPKPERPSEEAEAGRALTVYLLRGSDRVEPRFTFAPTKVAPVRNSPQTCWRSTDKQRPTRPRPMA